MRPLILRVRQLTEVIQWKEDGCEDRAEWISVPPNRGDKTPVELFLHFCVEIKDF